MKNLFVAFIQLAYWSYLVGHPLPAANYMMPVLTFMTSNLPETLHDDASVDVYDK